MYLFFKDNINNRDNRNAIRVFGVLFLLSLLSLISACAKQGYPSGGPRDTEPPKSVGCKPENAMRHFDRHQFFVEFDEYVVLKDADNNVLVSPPLKHKAEYSTKGHGIMVKIKDTLQENTTYLFQFKEAIADFNEGNVLPSFEYVFSTGSSMDTMMLAGRVLDARTGKPWKETLAVLAYREERCTTDTVAASEQPDFVTRCDKEGWFAFHYIPDGRYRLVAVEDKDRNLRVGNSEAVAFDNAVFAATDSIDSTAMAALRVSAPDRSQQRVLKSEFADPGRITIVTLLPMQAPQIGGEEVQWRLNQRRDTMTVWCLNEQCDSTVLLLADPATALNDTLKLRFKPRRRIRGMPPPEKKPLMSALCRNNSAYYDDLRLAFLNPIAQMRQGAMAEVMSMKDSVVHSYPLLLDSSGLMARVDAQLTSDEQYRMFLRDSLFTDLYGHYSDSLGFTLTPKDYGILTMHIDNATGNPLVVEVLDSKDTVVQRQTLTGAGGTLRFIHLPAAEYRLRAVVDADADGKWTAGDYRRQRQPEKCIPFDKTLKLREKWEMEERWRVENEE